ncbi:TRAP transporter substrate-binding protein [Noviherbaspirillum sp.]|uniref:TRAP transporter substrate-binding protein n=1 Tax=Noviherbaspirillum sp. TaxID=1926288 RepID=UPI002FE072E4
MKTMLAALGISALASCFSLAVQAPAYAAAVEINFATAYAADNFQTQNLQWYAEEVTKASAGRLTMKVHPAGSLIKPADIFAGVRSGKAEAGEVIMSSLAKENPLFGMDALPFIVSGYDDAQRMWEASRASIEKALAERGLQLLYAVPWPPQNLYSRKPISTVQDFKGLRMRAYNPATERIAELVRATPVTIQVVDLANAISTEKLDLMLTSSWTGVETKAWTKLQHYYKVNAWIPKNIVFINKKIFDKLDVDTQKKMLELAEVAEQRGWKLSRNSDKDYENLLAANDVSVSTMDSYIRQYLDRIGETLAREWLKQAGNDELKVLLKYTTDRSMNQASAK